MCTDCQMRAFDRQTCALDSQTRTLDRQTLIVKRAFDCQTWIRNSKFRIKFKLLLFLLKSLLLEKN
jgi:hypothetical protein